MAAKVFAIGDVHGCATELRALLEKINPTEDDTVVFLGDFIDRGPDSKGVVDLVLALKDQCHVVALKGNHEAMFLSFLESPESSGAGLFILNGGAATIASYAKDDGSFEIPESHLEFFHTLQMKFETPTHFFVHAGVPLRKLKTIDIEKDEMTLLWTRQPFLSTDYRWEKIVVHGHTPMREPEVFENRVNLDTGCVYDGHLTAMEVKSGRIYQVAKGVKGEAYKIPRDPGGMRIGVRYKGQLPVTASLVGKSSFHFETLNYNMFGLLMRDADASEAPRFVEGDIIEGRIGEDLGQASIFFLGEVVRVESKQNIRLYGVKISKLTNGDEGHEWISRP